MFALSKSMKRLSCHQHTIPHHEFGSARSLNGLAANMRCCRNWDRLIPAGKRLIEPFVGGGSVFCSGERFLLADVNADLINLYQMLAVVPDSVIYEAMKAFRHLNDAENYMVIREAFNAQRLDAVERTAAFLYLNRHCFNGLIRYNLDGFSRRLWEI